MRDKLSNIIETIDEIGQSIYVAERAAWNELVSRAGMSMPLATAIDILSITVGIALIISFSNAIQLLGDLAVFSGVVGLVRRYAA